MTRTGAFSLPKLETVNVAGIEVLGVGLWNGDRYDREDLDAMAAAFSAGNAGIDPPVKLGHTDKQRIVQKDGLPAAGYVSRLYRKGEKLLADFRDVPKRIADLINAKAYSKVSSEVWFNLKPPDGGKRLSRVLCGVALLGADVPAVTSLKDIEALYQADIAAIAAAYHWTPDATDDDDALPVRALATYAAESEDEDYAESLRAFMERIDGKLKGQKGMPAMRTFLRETMARLRALKPQTNNQEDEGMKDVLKKLGLADDADEAAVLAKIEEIEKSAADAKASAGAQPAEQSEYSAKFVTLQNEVGSLTAKLATRDAETAVEDAIRQGKVLPAQREWAKSYALDNAGGFAQYVEAAPAFPLGQRGSDAVPDAPQLTDAERTIAAQLGIAEEKVAESKKQLAAQRRG